MARGQQTTLANGMSGLTFRTNLNNMFSDLYGPSMALQTVICVDPNRLDTYTEDGSPQFPYKSLSLAFTALNGSTRPGVVINIAPSTYTESSQVTVPSSLLGKVVIYGNGSLITFTVGFSVPSAFAYPVSIHNLNFTTTTGVLSFANGTPNRNLLDNSVVGMALQVGSGGNAATVEARSCTINPPTAGVSVSAGSSFHPIGCSFTGNQPITVTGVLNMASCRVLTDISANYQLVSTTALAQVTVMDSYFSNPNVTAGSGCINVSNSALVGAPNFLGNIVALSGNTATNTVIAGTAYTVFSKIYQNAANINQVPAGTTIANILKSSDLMSVSDASNTGTSLYSGANPVVFNASASTALTLPSTGSVVVGPVGFPVNFTGITAGSLSLVVPAAGGSYNLPLANNSVQFTTSAPTALTLPTSGTLLSTASASVNAAATPGGTITSTTVLSLGIGATAGASKITPTQSSRILVNISGNVAIATAVGVISLRLYYGTTAFTYNTTPVGVGNSAATGSLYTLTPGAVGEAVPFSFSQVITGVAVNTLQYIELGAFASVANALTFTNLWVSIIEV